MAEATQKKTDSPFHPWFLIPNSGKRGEQTLFLRKRFGSRKSQTESRDNTVRSPPETSSKEPQLQYTSK